MENHIGIYGIENTANGMWYVGQSSNLFKRVGDHISILKRGKHENISLQNDFNMFGIDNFEVHILENCIAEKLNERECHWIKEKDSVNNGYNISTGGYSASGIKMSEETRRLLSEQRKGHIVSKETREKISKANKGRKPGFIGHKHTEEAKEKIAQAKRGISRPQSVKDAVSKANKGNIPVNRRAVMCIDTGETFESVRLAGKSVGGSGAGLSGALSRNKTYKGYVFKYLDTLEREVI